jgi:hypothetical protein
MKIRNSRHCNSSFEPRDAGWESNSRRSEGDGHEPSARSHFSRAGGDPPGRERPHARDGPDVSDRGREKPERNRAIELVAAFKLARPDAGRIRVTSDPGIVRSLVRYARQKETLENLCKAIPVAIWNQIRPEQDIAVEQVVGGNGGKGSFQFSCRKYLAESTD